MITFIIITDFILLILLISTLVMYLKPFPPPYTYSSKIPEVVDTWKLDIDYKKVKPTEV